MRGGDKGNYWVIGRNLCGVRVVHGQVTVPVNYRCRDGHQIEFV
jgi:hypothetical protein